MQNHCRSLLVLSATLLAGIAPALSQAAPHPPGGHPELPSLVNLQILPKNTTTSQLVSVMRGFNTALGVECGYCHVQDPATHQMNFASDAKPEKASARIMMRMTEDLNSKYLTSLPEYSGEKVACGTCHRGHAAPPEFVPGG